MNIIVNGGSRGIGKEVVLLLSGNPENKLLVTGRNGNALKQIVSGTKYRNVSYHITDLSSFDSQEESYRNAVISEMERVDILINNAGTLVVRDFLDFTNEDARKMMETNFFGPASVIRAVAPIMNKGGHIVNISSMGGFQGSSKYRGLSYYSASKAAISCLTECLAGELSDLGIIVNCLALGAVETEMFREAFPGFSAPVSASEMAGFIVNFAIEGRKYFNGKVLPVAMGNPKN